MVTRNVRLYIEGGSFGKQADNDFRRGWKKFLMQLHELARSHNFNGLVIVRGKGRSNTFERFKSHKSQFPDDLCALLVDSETAVASPPDVWNVVKNRTGDGWDKPNWATDRHLYLMVHFVETWLVTDAEAFVPIFGSAFDATKLPPAINLESRSKADINAALSKATRNCKRGQYGHGDAHRVIEYVRPERVCILENGKRLFEEMTELIKSQ